MRSLGFNKTCVDSASRSTVDGGLLHFHLLCILFWLRIRHTGRDDEGEEAAGGEHDEQVEEHQGVRVLRHHHRVQDSECSIWKGVSKTWSVSGGWISSPRNCLITNGPYNHAVQWVPEQTNGLEMGCAGNINETKIILAPERWKSGRMRLRISTKCKPPIQGKKPEKEEKSLIHAIKVINGHLGHPEGW